MGLIHNNNDNLIKEMYDKIEKLNEEIDLIKKQNYIVERDLFATYKTLEYKLWEYNNYNNIILYEMHFNGLKKVENYEPLVSIIIPAYNASNYLDVAINSALKQSYKNIEIIVVNDGSKDNGKTKKVALNYKDKITYYEKENGGVSSALNYGIRKMHGEFFTWLSHDDLMEENHISNLIKFIQYHSDEKVIPYSGFKIVDEKGIIKLNDTIIAQLHCYDYKTSLIKNEYTLLQGEINGGSVLIPKEAFEKYGLFNEKQRITQERDMWSRLIKEYKFINIPYDTAIIRSHSKQVTNTNNNIKEETDAKNLEIISDIDDKIKVRLAGSIENFYVIMSNFYKNNGNSYMKEKMDKYLEKEVEKNE